MSNVNGLQFTFFYLMFIYSPRFDLKQMYIIELDRNIYIIFIYLVILGFYIFPSMFFKQLTSFMYHEFYCILFLLF